MRFSYKHYNFSRVCLLVKMASKTLTRSICQGDFSVVISQFFIYAYFEDNPRDLRVFRNDRDLHPTRIQPHLKNVPEYLGELYSLALFLPFKYKSLSTPSKIKQNLSSVNPYFIPFLSVAATLMAKFSRNRRRAHVI